jgi:hypothetical protein
VTQVVRIVTKPAPAKTVTKPAPPALTTQQSSSSSPPSSSSGSDYSAGYPLSFESSFVQECAQTSGGASSACSCALKYIEQHVSYSAVVASFHTTSQSGIPHPGTRTPRLIALASDMRLLLMRCPLLIGVGGSPGKGSAPVAIEFNPGEAQRVAQAARSRAEQDGMGGVQTGARGEVAWFAWVDSANTSNDVFRCAT